MKHLRRTNKGRSSASSNEQIHSGRSSSAEKWALKSARTSGTASPSHRKGSEAMGVTRTQSRTSLRTNVSGKTAWVPSPGRTSKAPSVVLESGSAFITESDEHASLIEQIKQADKQAKETAVRVETMTSSIRALQAKPHKSDEENRYLKLQKRKLSEKMNEFEMVSKRIQDLVSLGSNTLGKAKVAVSEARETAEGTALLLASTEGLVREEPEKQMRHTPTGAPEPVHYLSQRGDTQSEIAKDQQSNWNLGHETERKEREDKPNWIPPQDANKDYDFNEQALPRMVVCATDPEDDGFRSGAETTDVSLPLSDKVEESVLQSLENEFSKALTAERKSITPNVHDKVTEYLHRSSYYPQTRPQSPLTVTGDALIKVRYDDAKSTMSYPGTRSNSAKRFEDGGRKRNREDVASLTSRLSSNMTGQERLSEQLTHLQQARLVLMEQSGHSEDVNTLRHLIADLEKDLNVSLAEKNKMSNKLDTFTDQEKELRTMEHEIQQMRSDLAAVQKDRQQLRAEKMLLQCTLGQKQSKLGEVQNAAIQTLGTASQEVLQEKNTEVASLRVENERLRLMAQSMQDKLESAETALHSVHQRPFALQSGDDKSIAEREEELGNLLRAKHQLKGLQDEVEELRSQLLDCSSQLDDYRSKYLRSQQVAEEYRQKMEEGENERKRLQDEAALELQKVRSQLQERLSDVVPLQEVLKATQHRLQDTQQRFQLAETRAEQLSKQINDMKEQMQHTNEQLEKYKHAHASDEKERQMLSNRLATWEKRAQELQETNARLQAELARRDEVACQVSRRLDEKIREAASLNARLEACREKANRERARSRDRANARHRQLKSQLEELEQQLAQTKAAARNTTREKDEVNKRLKSQVSSLSDSLDQAQSRVQSLQTHISLLKSSYSALFGNEPMSILTTDLPTMSSTSILK